MEQARYLRMNPEEARKKEKDPLFLDSGFWMYGSKVPLREDACLCCRPLQRVGGKYVKCGRSKDEMKKGERPCTLFCEAEDWPAIVSELRQRFPEGLFFEEDWPECSHRLKARVAVNQKKTGCYLACRMNSMSEPDVPCDYFEWISKSKTQDNKADGDKRYKRRKIQ